MTVLITMAGLGSRFTDAGYSVPKYRIKAHGTSLFEWSMRSMQNFFDQPFVFACLDSEDEKWIENEAKHLGINEVIVSKRKRLSQGQAETAYDAIKCGATHAPLWIFNIDTYVREDAMSPNDIGSAGGCVHVFPSDASNMSFVSYNQAGKVEEVVEKKVISQWATVGLYGFSSSALFCEFYERAYVNGQVAMVGGERYVAPIYNLMIKENIPVVAPKLMPNDVSVLGTPIQVIEFDPLAVPPLGR